MQPGFVGCRLGFGDRYVLFGHGEFRFVVVVGGCLGFGRAWAGLGG